MWLCSGAFAAVVKATGKADHRPYALKVVTRSAYRHYYHMMNQVLHTSVLHTPHLLSGSHMRSLNAMPSCTRSRLPDVHKPETGSKSAVGSVQGSEYKLLLGPSNPPSPAPAMAKPVYPVVLHKVLADNRASLFAWLAKKV